MAKYEKILNKSVDEALNICNDAIMKGSVTAHLEDGSDFASGDTKIAVRVYERYSALGSNRVSINLTLVGMGDKTFVSAITAGGSQAVFFKLNTFGESAFLDTLSSVLEKY